MCGHKVAVTAPTTTEKVRRDTLSQSAHAAHPTVSSSSVYPTLNTTVWITTSGCPGRTNGERLANPELDIASPTTSRQRRRAQWMHVAWSARGSQRLLQCDPAGSGVRGHQGAQALAQGSLVCR